MRGSVVGLPEGFSLKGNSPIHYGFLVVLDTLISILIIAPTVIGYWRSVWELSSLYIYPQDEFISAIISTIIGYVGHLICMLCQHFFTRTLHPDKNRITFYVCSRIYTVCFAFFCVNGWRGPWLLLNLVTGSEITPVLSTTLIGIIILILIKGLRNVLAVPFVVLPDDVKGYFEVRTMFKISMIDRPPGIDGAAEKLPSPRRVMWYLFEEVGLNVFCSYVRCTNFLVYIPFFKALYHVPTRNCADTQ